MGAGRADVEALSSVASLAVQPYCVGGLERIYTGRTASAYGKDSPHIREGQPPHMRRTARTYEKDSPHIRKGPPLFSQSRESHVAPPKSAVSPDALSPAHPQRNRATLSTIICRYRKYIAGREWQLHVGPVTKMLRSSVEASWPVRVPHVSVDVFFGASDTHFPFSSTVSDGEGERRREAHCTVRKT